MLRRYVVFSLKPEVRTEERERLFARMREVWALNPTVKRPTIGKAWAVLDDSGKPKRPIEFEWSFSMDFNNADDEQIYADDVHHRAFADELKQYFSAVKRMDFEILGV